MTEATSSVTFDEVEVRKWCRRSGDSNQIHLSKEAAADSPFDERVVPGMMILDIVSGAVSLYGEAEDCIPILAGIVACRFREPVYFDQYIEVTVEKTDEDNKFSYLDFEVRSEDDLHAHGTLSIVEG